MGEKKTKIVLDADVINHFVRGGGTIIATEDISGISVHRSHGITYLTTNDFLFYAIQRGLLKKEEAEDFIRIVISMGSNPPKVDFDQYICSKI